METREKFGVSVVDERVQARVNASYDGWQREILSRFGVKLGNAMKEMHASILKARNDLEHQSIEGPGGQLPTVRSVVFMHFLFALLHYFLALPTLFFHFPNSFFYHQLSPLSPYLVSLRCCPDRVCVSLTHSNTRPWYKQKINIRRDA
ncbi:hypothetical protein BJV74DRAFT_626427 [Russula compacta]|nr:hypothetical protein BJV74DRAFT_626427 [Russula compacta]